MDVRYQFVIYIMIGLFAVILTLVFLGMRRPSEYHGGKKIASADRLNNLKYYRVRMLVYKVLTVATIITCLAGFICSGILVSRPYKEKIHTEQDYNRDIILCIDISTSVDALNAKLIDGLKDTVNDLSGDRFGIVIFNTSSIYLCPLTDDYNYVLDELDRLESALKDRARSGIGYSSSTYLEDCEFLEAGTLVGNEERGSSLIADGLAATVYDFTYDDESENRSRFIIFSTDNDPQGDSYVTLQEAADLCSDHGIVVYGIGTKEMTDSAADEMKEAVESTDGLFFLQEESGGMDTIVEEIDQAQQSLVDGDTVVLKVDDFKATFILLVIAVLLTYIMRRIIRR